MPRIIYSDPALFLVLTRVLPPEYATTIDTLDIQTQLSVDDKLKHLIAKENRLENNLEHANIAKSSRYISPFRRERSSSAESQGSHTGECYLCKKDHYLRNCLHIEVAGKLLRKHL